MSKLETISEKLAEAMIPKIRKIIREELDYKFESMGRNANNNNSNSSNLSPKETKAMGLVENRRPDYSKVIESFDMSGKDDVIVDVEGNTVNTSELASKNPKAKSILDKISNMDYSHLID